MRRTTMDKLSSWKIWLVVAGCLVLAYLVAALTVLPQWLVSQNLGGVDANTRLNAITATRVALLGILTPVVIAIAGVVAALGYGETVRHNRRTDELARRQHRADANTDLLVAWDECMTAASTLYHGGSPDPDERLLQWQALFAKRVAVDRATDRATLFSAESVRTTARALGAHTSVHVASRVVRGDRGVKPTEAEWDQINAANTDLYREFMAAARADLEPTS